MHDHAKVADRLGGYEVLAVLGHGAKSTIYAVQEPDTHQVYALKHVVRDSAADQRFLDQAYIEHEIASKLDHPTLRRSIKLIKRRKLVRTSEVLVLMELVDGVTLMQQRPATLGKLIEVFSHVAEGLGAMHRLGYVHADIKPNNILVDEAGQVKIIDFGQSCELGMVKQRIQGTPDYIAPEQVRREQLDARTDVFNLGATMYWCVTETHVPTLIGPDHGLSVDTKMDRLLRPPHEFNANLPEVLNKLIVSCLRDDPRERPQSMSEVRARLNVAAKQAV